MKIRSITCFLDPSDPLTNRQLKLTAEFLPVAIEAFSAAGYEVQTSRLATVPFPKLLDGREDGELARLAKEMETRASDMGYAYLSLGPAQAEYPGSYAPIPAALAATRNTFFSGSMTTAAMQVSLPAVRSCARVIHEAATLSPDGFANLRFAALAAVPPGSPFFPAAYHSGGNPVFALAPEAADLAVTAFDQASSLQEGRRKLIDAIEQHGRELKLIANKVARKTGMHFGGIDFSLAPFPTLDRSLGTALEQLGVTALGGHGSLAVAAILADSLDQARFKRTGFSGLLLPVLEDAVLAQRVADGNLGVKDLLLYSAVCGTGLDTIPLPGDTTTEQLAALLLDVASLSLRLGKPLTARLMPIPGKKAGDPTGFDFEYFANSRVMALETAPLKAYLSGDESFSLRPRRTYGSKR